MNRDLLLRLDRSRALAALVLAAVFLLMLFCTHETDLIADDYRYCFSFADDSRIESVGQIFPSMAAHRESMNGRVIAHFLVQLFLLLPKGCFDVLNALVFTALVPLTAALAAPGERPGALPLMAVFGCIWCLQPNFGQVYLWLDGAVNYLWCAAACLVWLLPWRARFLAGREPHGAGAAAYVVFSFAVGAFSENSTVALVAMALLALLLLALREKKCPPRWMLCSLAAVLAGFFYMMLAPAESVNKSAELRLAVLLANTLEALRWYLRFWPLLVSLGLLHFLAGRMGVPAERRLLSLVYLFGSLAAHFVLVFAMYIAGRSTFIVLILLIAANAALFVPLLETEKLPLLALLCALCLGFTAWRVPLGVRDIRRTHTLLRFNEELVTACAASGETRVELPCPWAETEYSALEGLGYLSLEDSGYWANVYMAKYYGVEEIIGYR